MIWTGGSHFQNHPWHAFSTAGTSTTGSTTSCTAFSWPAEAPTSPVPSLGFCTKNASSIGWSKTWYKNCHICQHKVSEPLWVAAWACKTSTSETLSLSRVPKLMDRKFSSATHQIHKHFLSVGKFTKKKLGGWPQIQNPTNMDLAGVGFPRVAADVHTTTLLSFRKSIGFLPDPSMLLAKALLVVVGNVYVWTRGNWTFEHAVGFIW